MEKARQVELMKPIFQKVIFVAFREMILTPKIENHETHFPKCKLVAFKEPN